MMMKFKYDTNGVVAIFEEIPVVIIVTITLGFFLLSFLSAYGQLHEQERKSDLEENLLGFSNLVLSYDGLMDEQKGRAGFYDGDKILTLTSEKLKNDLCATADSNIDFNYEIMIQDLSMETSSARYNKTFTVGNLTSGNIISRFWTIDIRVSDSEIHIGRLLITIGEK